MSKSELQHISPKQALEMMQQEPNMAFVDVRSEMEFLFIGLLSILFGTLFQRGRELEEEQSLTI